MGSELLINHQKECTIEEVAEETHRERLEASARAAQRALEKQEEAAAAVSVPEPAPAPAPFAG